MTTHTKEKLGVMLDVVIEKGNNNYILCPGQAVPIHMENTLFEDLYDVRLELMTCHLSGNAYYTDLSSNPIPYSNISGGVAERACCASPFGLEVIKMTGNVIGVYAENPPYRVGNYRRWSPLKVAKFIELSAIASPILNPYEEVAPAFYLRLANGADKIEDEVALFDLSCGGYGRFVRINLPCLLSRPDKGKAAAWKKAAMSYAMGSMAMFELFFDKNPQYEKSVYVSFGQSPVGFKVPEGLVTPEAYKSLRLFSGRNPRRLIYVPYHRDDPFVEIDGDRRRIWHFVGKADNLRAEG